MSVSAALLCAYLAGGALIGIGEFRQIRRAFSEHRHKSALQEFPGLRFYIVKNMIIGVPLLALSLFFRGLTALIIKFRHEKK